ncbi:chaperone protein DnaJ [Diplogelasinospora grovesii]|uniref:Chaperone protein DnaJ n=1 Tax=Diplogelasinospora grovesii TaxID=303347 RepID=A0AAN6NBU2_9PEZI|nr:chaperone protein DnaJ [Diplogelasinospora grovesii]
MPPAVLRSYTAVAGAALRLGQRSCASQTATLRLRKFHTSRALQDDAAIHGDKNHYETLNVQTDASAADIKKSYFKLSKTHHPDHNPHDPHASRRFMRISEAYRVLSHVDRRSTYDRDVLRLHTRRHPPHSHHGSYSSTGPAGGRPASGLSKRRGTFTGPPPSFFRSGGWGAQSAKRRAAHEESTGGGASSHPNPGGMGPGSTPNHHPDAFHTPHFDRDSHERTHQRNDERMARRRAERERILPETGTLASFFVVSGILVVAVLGPYLIFGGWRKAHKEREKAKRKKAAPASAS